MRDNFTGRDTFFFPYTNKTCPAENSSTPCLSNSPSIKSSRPRAYFAVILWQELLGHMIGGLSSSVTLGSCGIKLMCGRSVV